MPGRRLSRVLIVCAAVVLSGTDARAASVEEETQRLDDLTYFVQELQRGWDPLLAEFESTIDALRNDGSGGTRPEDALRPVLALRDEVVWKRAEELFGTGSEAVEERCLQLYRTLATGAVDLGRRSAAKQRLADISIRRGERFEAAGDEAAALAAYLEAVDHAPDYQLGYEKVGALGISQADRQSAAQEFDASLETLAQVLQRIERGLPSSHPRIAEARSRRDQILSSTGVITLRLVGDAGRLQRVRGPRTDFASGEIRLAPLDGGAAPAVVSAGAPRRVRAARYRATVTGVGGPERVEVEVAVAASGGEIAVPAAIPAGMVWVPAAAGAPSFLCDRTEVSNSDYATFVNESGGRSVGGAPNLPAAGVPFADAQRFANWAGKQLPTHAQWTHVAFGSPGAGSPRYPWGDAEGSPGVHFFGKRSDPGPVDGCPSGASRAGVLNLAGNVFEWLADGWFIGGGYTTKTFGQSQNYATPVGGQTSWMADFLRDKVPTPAVYDGLSPDQKNKHNVYRVKPEQADAFLKLVGFRCVIPLE